MTASHNPATHPHLHVFESDTTTRAQFIAMREWCDQLVRETDDYDARWQNYDEDRRDIGDAWFAFREPGDFVEFKLRWIGA